jgi:hypothetical protein
METEILSGKEDKDLESLRKRQHEEIKLNTERKGSQKTCAKDAIQNHR